MITSAAFHKKDTTQIKLPAMFVSLSSKAIVLFLKENDGVVLFEGDYVMAVGYRSDEFTSCFNANEWAQVHGSVTLTQE